MNRSVVKALALAALLLAAPVIDFVEWSRWRQENQRRIDRAAINQAEHMQAGRGVDPSWLDRIRPGQYGFTGTSRLEHPPLDGAYAGRRDVVRVSARVAHRPLFTSVFTGPISVDVRATAGVRPTGRGSEARVVLLE